MCRCINQMSSQQLLISESALDSVTEFESGDEVLTARLNAFFSDLDAICKECGCVKIKTVGDCYMIASGCLSNDHDPVDSLMRAVVFGWKAIKCLQEQTSNDRLVNADMERYEHLQLPTDCRVGLHRGPFTAGVIGKDRLQYDLWGETV